MTIYFRTKPILPRAIRDGDLKSLSTTKLNHDARIVGETTGDAGAGSWFLTNVARSVGWHKGTVKVGPALVDNTNQVDFSVDDILALSHNSKTAFGYNVLEFNTDFGAFTGYFDDAKFGTISQPTTVPEPSSLLLLLGGMAAMAFSRRCRRAF